MKVKYVPIFALVGVLTVLSGMPLLSSGSIITNYAYARYANTNTQSQGNTNECNTGTNCAITSPQTQGDGTANSPTNLQISKFNEEEQDGGVGEEPPTSPGPITNGLLVVTKRVICNFPEGLAVCPTPDKFQMSVQVDRGTATPSTFPGEFPGTFVRVSSTESSTGYTVREELPPTPEGLSVDIETSVNCTGTLSVFDPNKVCTFTNEYKPTPPTLQGS